MTISFELFDLDSGNFVGEFASQIDVLETLSRLSDEQGDAAIAHLSMIAVRDGQQTIIAMDETLVSLVSEFKHNAKRIVAR